MAASNLETIRGIYERWSEGDFSAGPEHFDPNVVFILSPEFPDSGAYHGPQEVAAYMRAFLEPWTRLTISATELLAAGDSIVATVHQRGSGASSGAETDLRYFQVWTCRGEKIIRLDNLMNREGAFGGGTRLALDRLELGLGVGALFLVGASVTGEEGGQL